MARPKLILYTDSPMVGGAEHYLGMIVPLLAPYWELVLFHRPDADLSKMLTLLPQKSVRIVSAARAGLRFANLEVLKSAFAKEQPDLIFFNLSNYYTSKVGLMAATLGRWPFVLYEHGVPVDGRTFGTLANRLFLAWLLPRARAVLAPSQAVARFFASQLRFRGVTVIPHGINQEFFKPSPSDRTKIRQELEIPLAARVLLYVGHFDARKRPDRVIDVFNSLAGQFPDLYLILLGAGPLENDLRAQAAASAANDRIHLLSWRPSTAPIMAASDLLIHLSSSESFGLVVAEAMALGVVPVVSKVDALPEVVGEAGYLVDPDDEQQSRAAISELLINKSHYRALQNKGRQRIHEHFDRGQMGERLQAILGLARLKKVTKEVVSWP